MTVPDPLLILDASVVVGIVAGLVLRAFAKVNWTGATLLAVGVVDLGAAAYALIPLCSNQQVLSGGNVINCFQWQAPSVPAVLAGMAGLVAAILCFGSLSSRYVGNTRRGMLVLAGILTVPVAIPVLVDIVPLLITLTMGGVLVVLGIRKSLPRSTHSPSRPREMQGRGATAS